MSRVFVRKRLTALALLASLGVTGCVVRARKLDVEPVRAGPDRTVIESPVKAHLLDGSTVVYTQGVTIGADSLRGPGRRFDLALNPVGETTLLPLDSVIGMENFREGTNVPATVVLSIPATALGIVGTAGLLAAVFGSCPTVYADSAGTLALEAEGFSYSIAPLLENRDTDRLSARADSDGTVRLEVRNEALETHYLNHLELLEVRHAADEAVMPDPRGKPLVLRDLLAPTVAADRAGRNVRSVLAAADGDVFATDPHTLAAVRAEDMTDHVDLSFPAPPGADSAAVVLRMRNSLLTTVLLYDLMLGSASSLDWLGRDLERVGGALELGRWYVARMGMRISVWQDGGYTEVTRIMDTGPIAWKDIAAVIPVPPGDTLRVRLSFVADEWRIDRAALATGFRRASPRVIPVASLTNAEENPEPQALAALAAPDETYLQTTPGQRFSLRFHAGPASAREQRTFLLAAQGYYTEWVRRDWLRSARPAFRPSDEALLAAVQRWKDQQQTLEDEFYRTRIPVR